MMVFDHVDPLALPGRDDRWPWRTCSSIPAGTYTSKKRTMRAVNGFFWIAALLINCVDEAISFIHGGLIAPTKTLAPDRRQRICNLFRPRRQHSATKPGREEPELDDDEIANIIESNKPSEMTVMKEVRRSTLELSYFLSQLCRPSLLHSFSVSTSSLTSYAPLSSSFSR